MKPQDFDKERGCDPTKKKKGPVDRKVVHCGPGQGGGGGSGSKPSMDPETGINPDVHDPAEGPPDIVTDPSAGPPPEPPPVIDPIEQFNGTGVLWFGTSSVYDDDISIVGLQKLALSNPIFDPDKPPTYIPLTISPESAKELFADLSVQKYGGEASIYRIVCVDDGSLLSKDPDNKNVVRYSGNSVKSSYLEKFE
jgi:hypothetical protein